MKTLKRLSIAAIAGAVFLSACGGGGGEASSGGEDGGRSASYEGAKDGGTLYVLSSDEGVTTLDPQRVYTGAELGAYATTLFRTLTTYTPVKGKGGYELAADMATDLGTSSDDFKKWEFTLRDGLTWEDGSETTCEDVAYGISRTFGTEVTGFEGPLYAIDYLDIPEGDTDNGTAYPGPWLATPEEQALYDAAVVCDGKKITFNLKVAVPDFNYTLAMAAYGPVPEAKDTADQYGLLPVSNGPFKVESYEEGVELVMVRNENWSQDSDPVRTPQLDKIVWQFGLTDEVIDERMLADQGDDQFAITYGGPLPASLTTIFGDDQYKDRRLDGFDIFVTYVMFNNEKIPCEEVRRAIWYAIDREALRTNAGGPYTGSFADSFMSPTLSPDYAPAELPEALNKDGKPNIEAAQAEMEKAKTECPDVHEMVTTDGLNYIRRDSSVAAKAAAIWIDSMSKIGIKITDEAIDGSKYYAYIQDNPQDIAPGGWGSDWANGSTVIPPLFGETGGYNNTNNSSDPDFPEFQAKIDEALAETDRDKQVELWRELDQMVIDKVWAYPGTALRTQQLSGSKVRGAFLWVPFGWFAIGEMAVAE